MTSGLYIGDIARRLLLRRAPRTAYDWLSLRPALCAPAVLCCPPDRALCRCSGEKTTGLGACGAISLPHCNAMCARTVMVPC
jgi:hypothetical protein